ncbi:MAG: hypothetical protein V7L21_21785 [Nostoc sp.]|uniref:hypothetical protein n=1 Tax=Nostoc sp. TaxID=1180 RepID=UPI002FF6181D
MATTLVGVLTVGLGVLLQSSVGVAKARAIATRTIDNNREKRIIKTSRFGLTAVSYYCLC